MLQPLSIDVRLTRTPLIPLPEAESTRPDTETGAAGIRWSPDGRFISYPDEANGIWMQDVKGGEPSRLKGVPTEKTYSYAWSPDGKLFALGRQREVRDVLMMRDFR